MFRDESLELPDEVAMPTEPELELDPLADRGEPELFEPRDLGPGEVLERKFLERRPSPKAERVAQQPDRALRIVVGTGFGDEPLEAIAVELSRLEAKQITRRPREDQLVVGAFQARLEQSPQVRHVRLDHVGRRLRPPLAPDVLDQARAGNDLVCTQEQAQEERALLRGSHMHHAA